MLSTLEAAPPASRARRRSRPRPEARVVGWILRVAGRCHVHRPAVEPDALGAREPGGAAHLAARRPARTQRVGDARPLDPHRRAGPSPTRAPSPRSGQRRGVERYRAPSIRSSVRLHPPAARVDRRRLVLEHPVASCTLASRLPAGSHSQTRPSPCSSPTAGCPTASGRPRNCWSCPRGCGRRRGSLRLGRSEWPPRRRAAPPSSRRGSAAVIGWERGRAVGGQVPAVAGGLDDLLAPCHPARGIPQAPDPVYHLERPRGPYPAPRGRAAQAPVGPAVGERPLPERAAERQRRRSADSRSQELAAAKHGPTHGTSG